MIRNLFFAVMLFLPFIIQAQHLPLYSQYMLNPLVLNPAYTGARQGLTTVIQYRKQWVGFDPDEDISPKTLSFSIDTPLRNKRFAIGTIGVIDQYAVTKQMDQLALLSYRIKLGKLTTMAVGFQAGYLFSRTDYSSLNVNDDVAFSNGYSSYLTPKLGTGAMLHVSKFFIGLSMPQVFIFKQKNALGKTNSIYGTLIYAHTGYNMKISNNVHIRPNILVKLFDYNLGASVDVNTMVDWKQNLSLGISYRNKNAMIVLAELKLNQLSIGYAYDYSLNQIRSNGSHEILLKYIFRYGIKATDIKTFR